MQIENDIENKLIKAVKAVGGECLKWSSPGQTGVPDRMILMPGGVVAFAELKRPKGGRLSAKQKYWGEKLRGMGFIYEVIHNEDEIEDLISLCDAKLDDRYKDGYNDGYNDGSLSRCNDDDDRACRMARKEGGE